MNTTVTKLSWAGVRLNAGGEQLVVDGLEGRQGEVQGRIGQPRKPLVDLADRPVDFALVTHTHKDHFDADALRRKLATHGRVVVPLASVAEVRELGFDVVGVAPWQRIQLGVFEVMALPAVDGFGAAQVSWHVAAPGVRIVHLGDTLFHGFWWEMARHVGGADVLFAPINGARVTIPGLPPTGLPGIMTAEQAAVAARLLQARLAVPMHYEEFHAPPVYNADLHAEATFLQHASQQGVATNVVAAGEIAFAA